MRDIAVVALTSTGKRLRKVRECENLYLKKARISTRSIIAPLDSAILTFFLLGADDCRSKHNPPIMAVTLWNTSTQEREGIEARQSKKH